MSDIDMVSDIDMPAVEARVSEAVRVGRIDARRLLDRAATDARLLGMHVTHTRRWVCCRCTTGEHTDETEWMGGLFSTESEAMAEHAYTSSSHVASLERLVIRTRPVEVPL